MREIYRLGLILAGALLAAVLCCPPAYAACHDKGAALLVSAIEGNRVPASAGAECMPADITRPFPGSLNWPWQILAARCMGGHDRSCLNFLPFLRGQNGFGHNGSELFSVQTYEAWNTVSVAVVAARLRKQGRHSEVVDAAQLWLDALFARWALFAVPAPSSVGVWLGDDPSWRTRISPLTGWCPSCLSVWAPGERNLLRPASRKQIFFDLSEVAEESREAANEDAEILSSLLRSLGDEGQTLAPSMLDLPLEASNAGALLSIEVGHIKAGSVRNLGTLQPDNYRWPIVAFLRKEVRDLRRERRAQDAFRRWLRSRSEESANGLTEIINEIVNKEGGYLPAGPREVRVAYAADGAWVGVMSPSRNGNKPANVWVRYDGKGRVESAVPCRWAGVGALKGFATFDSSWRARAACPGGAEVETRGLVPEFVVVWDSSGARVTAEGSVDAPPPGGSVPPPPPPPETLSRVVAEKRAVRDMEKTAVELGELLESLQKVEKRLRGRARNATKRFEPWWQQRIVAASGEASISLGFEATDGNMSCSPRPGHPRDLLDACWDICEAELRTTGPREAVESVLCCPGPGGAMRWSCYGEAADE